MGCCFSVMPEGPTRAAMTARSPLSVRTYAGARDGFELACDNGEKVRVAFALDCCDREAMAWVATTQGIKSEDVRDLMVASVESRFGQVNRLPRAIEWLSDNGSGYIAKDTKTLRARSRIRAAHDPRDEPAVQRHGRGLRANDQTRLRPRQSSARRPNRHRKPASLVRALQQGSSAQRLALSFATRVHRCAIKRGVPCPVFRGHQQFGLHRIVLASYGTGRA